MKIRIRLQGLSLLFTFIILFQANPGLAAENTCWWGLGFSFGSPGILSLRTVLQGPSSNLRFQGEYSNQVLHRNRTDGHVESFRFDVQSNLLETLDLQPFWFAGVIDINGQLNIQKADTPIHLLGFTAGSGLRVNISEHLELPGEVGLIVPVQSVKGFEFVGLIFNLGLTYRF